MVIEKSTIYRDSISGVAFYLIPQAGFLSIAGEDRVGYLQRQTTNDMALLVEAKALMSVLTSPTARILDVFYLLNLADSIGAITLPGQAEITARFLKSRIFFMDKVTVDDVSEGFAQFEILGREAGEALNSINFNPMAEIDEVSHFRITDQDIYLFRMQPTLGLGFRLLAPASVAPEITVRLKKSGIIELDEATYHLLRIEKGLPFVGNELNEAYTPLETGLKTAVSEHKGCYTGQEVIARQITYDKVTQRLCGLKLEAPVETGAKLWKDGKSAGVITSVALSPRFGPIGLAMIRKPFDEPGKLLDVGDPESGITQGEVVHLPFEDAASDRKSP
jgi:folate-binding protein YgfZ